MRKHSLLVASTLALAVATSMVPSLAHAACTDAAGRCGDGVGKGIVYKYDGASIEPGAVNFEWTSPTQNVILFDVRLRAGLELAFAKLSDPVKGGDQPIFTVNLDKAPLVATWSAQTKKITIQRVDATALTSSLDVRYTLQPQAYVALDQVPAPPTAPSQLYRYNYNLNDIFSNTIGNPNFRIDGNGSKPFAPWALTGLDAFLVEGGEIPSIIDPQNTNSSLFTQPWSFGDNPDTPVADPDANGTFGVYVKANPEFTYKTLTVKYGDQDLGGDATADLPVATEYGNSIKVPVKVRGGIRVDGNVQAKPYLMAEQIFGFGPFTFETGFGQLTREYNIPTANDDDYIGFDFPSSAEVVIPIPNVKLVKSTLEFTGVAGTQGSGTVTIKNEGEAPAKITFEPTGDFTVNSQGTTISPGGSFDVVVKATPAAAGTVTGSIKVVTNDPDSPFLELGVNGEFTSAPIPPDNSGGDDDSGDDDSNTGKGTGSAAAEDSGCGCKTAGAPASSPLGVLGALALGAAALIRRRRAR